MSHIYMDLHGKEIPLEGLDKEERGVITLLQQRVESRPDWIDFNNFWPRRVLELYDRRGRSRSDICKSVIFRIAQDLSNRIGIKCGMVGCPDYRDDLKELIQERYPTQRAFCEAAGLTEDMLSHVLSRRRHFSIETLMPALERVGCSLRIVAVPEELRGQ